MLNFNDYSFKLIKILFIIYIILNHCIIFCTSQNSTSNYYLSNDGINELNCGSLNKPCLDLIYLFKNDLLVKENNNSIYFFPGVYNHSLTINITDYCNGINLIGIGGRDKTIITTKPSVRGFLLINSTVNIIGISFNRIYISRNSAPPYIPKGIIRDQIYSDYLVQLYFTGGGGAFQAVFCRLLISSCRFSHNRASNGGALFTVATNSTISNCIFSFNTAVQRREKGGNGGAIAIGPLSFSNLFNNTFHNNRATNGGAIIQTNSVLYDYQSIYYYNIGSNGAVSLIFNHSVYFAFGNSYLYNQANLSGVANIDTSSALYSSCKFIGNLALSYSGVFSMLYGSFLYVTSSIIQNNFAPSAAILENQGTRAAIFINCDISYSTDFKIPGIVQSTFSISNFNFLQIKDSTVTRLTGTTIWCNSNAIISIYNVTFTELCAKVINIHSQGFLFSTSCTFKNNTFRDYSMVLRNGAMAMISRNSFINNTASSLIFNTYNSTIYLIESSFFYNVIKDELIIALKGYRLEIHNSMFKNNIGTSRGCIVYTDQWGKIRSYNNFYVNNTSIYGTLFYFSTIKNLWYKKVNGTFLNDTIQSNIAYGAGAITYYSNKVLVNYTCVNCLIERNKANNGDDINSNYYSFYVLQVSSVQSNQEFPSIIYAYDHFGNLIRGRNDIIFVVQPYCLNSNLSLDGVKGSVIQTNGITTLYNLKINQVPGTNCNLTYHSLPNESELGPINKTITIQECPGEMQIFDVNNGQVYECLTVKDISRVAKIVICIITGMAAAFSIFCLAFTIKYIDEKVINFGNTIFLIVVIIACLIFCIMIFISIKISNITCIITTILLPIGFGLLFTMVLLKQYRIYKLFRYSDFLKINTDNLQMIKYASIIMSPIIVLLIIGLITYPVRPKYFFNLQYKTATHQCYSTKWYIFSIVIAVYDVLLLFISCIISFKSIRYHSTPGTFYESLFNSILIYNYSIIFTVLIPLFYVLQSNPTTSFLVISIGCLLMIYVTLFIIYLPKFNFLLRKNQIVSSLKKVIETQEREIERNKDLLIFYKMFLIDRNNLDNPIFNIHETFSSDEEDKQDIQEKYYGESLNKLKKEFKKRKKKYKQQHQVDNNNNNNNNNNNSDNNNNLIIPVNNNNNNNDNNNNSSSSSSNTNNNNNSNCEYYFNISTPTLYERNQKRLNNNNSDSNNNNNNNNVTSTTITKRKSKSTNSSPLISNNSLRIRKSQF